MQEKKLQGQHRSVRPRERCCLLSRAVLPGKLKNIQVCGLCRIKMCQCSLIQWDLTVFLIVSDMHTENQPTQNLWLSSPVPDSSRAALAPGLAPEPGPKSLGTLKGPQSLLTWTATLQPWNSKSEVIEPHVFPAFLSRSSEQSQKQIKKHMKKVLFS